MKKIIICICCILLVSTGCSKKVEESKTVEDTKPQESIEEVIESSESKKTIDNITYKEVDKKTNYVKLETSKGIILIELYPKVAPITVKNFKKLVNDKFYDGLIFHRVVKDFVIQTGDPKGTGYGGSENKIKGEFKSNGVENNLSHTRGIVSMARAQDPNSASSQFFIVSEDATFLDGDYAAFGKVIAGLDVVDKISAVDVDKYDKPVSTQKLKSIRFIEIEG